jgi:hypothetical protein
MALPLDVGYSIQSYHTYGLMGRGVAGICWFLCTT